jgi:diaminopimelate decarboxylase
MDRCSLLIKRHFASVNGELSIGGVAVSDLAAYYDTPLFIYDRGVLDTKWELLRNALPPPFSIFYSIKANPNRRIIQHFLNKGAGLEVASAGEFLQAISAGCTANNIIFAGPGKTDRELKLAIDADVGEIHIESVHEAERIARLGVRTRVAIRVNPSGEAEGGAMRMGGRSTAFGIDEECLDAALDRILGLPTLSLRGIHLFAGTQILDANLLIEQYRHGLCIARQVANRLGRPLSSIDFGGGLGIPYFEHEHELDMDELRNSLHTLWNSAKNEPLLRGIRCIIEPGRFLVGEAGIYVARVNDIKMSRGRKFAILDGGLHHHLAASGNLGQTIKRNYPIAVLNKLERPVEETVEIVGPLCTPLDVLGRSVALPSLDVGDLIGVFQSGAYARSASPLGFLSHPTPPEVWTYSGSHELIRRRGTVSDYLVDQCL